jgi:hypothetical protein
MSEGVEMDIGEIERVIEVEPLREPAEVPAREPEPVAWASGR